MRDFMRRRLWDALVVLAAVAVALGVRAALAPSGASAATRGQWGDLLGYGALEEALSFIASGGMSLAADQAGMASKLANGLAVLSDWLERCSRYAVVACAQGGR